MLNKLECFEIHLIRSIPDDEADSQTEGEELEKARAIRMQEAKVKPVQYLPTDTETEVRIKQFSHSPSLSLVRFKKKKDFESKKKRNLFL